MKNGLFNIPGLEDRQELDFSYCDGIIWISAESADVVINTDGDVFMDLHELGNIDFRSVLNSDGRYCGVRINGADGLYYSVIDLQNKVFTFEPIKVNACRGVYSGGISTIEVDGEVLYLDLNGEIIMEFEGDMDYFNNFHEGYCFDPNNYVYRNTKGEIAIP